MLFYDFRRYATVSQRDSTSFPETSQSGWGETWTENKKIPEPQQKQNEVHKGIEGILDEVTLTG